MVKDNARNAYTLLVEALIVKTLYGEQLNELISEKEKNLSVIQDSLSVFYTQRHINEVKEYKYLFFIYFS